MNLKTLAPLLVAIALMGALQMGGVTGLNEDPEPRVAGAKFITLAETGGEDDMPAHHGFTRNEHFDAPR